MEATLCPLNSLRVINSTNKFYYETPPRVHHKLSLFPSFSSAFPSLKFPGNLLHKNGGFSAFCSTSSHHTRNPSQELALLLEVDGYLTSFILSFGLCWFGIIFLLAFLVGSVLDLSDWLILYWLHLLFVFLFVWID